jgi:hypothetical protein
LKRGNRLFVRGHDARRAAIAGGTDHGAHARPREAY